MSARQETFVPTRRHWLIAVVGLVVLLAAGLYRGHGFLFDEARERAEQQLQAVAALKLLDVQRWIDDRRVFLSQPPDGVMARSFANLRRGDAAAGAVLQARFRHLRATLPEVAAIWLYDASGQPVLGSDESPPHADARHSEAARQVVEARRPALVDFHRAGEGPADAVLEVLVPLIVGADKEATAVGHALFQLDPAKVLYPMLQLWPVPSDSAESFLVTREGDEVVALTPLRHSAAPPLTLRRPLATPGLIAGQALRGGGTVLTGVDYRGIPALGVALKIPGTDWMLVTKMDEAEVYREARRTFLWLAAAGLAFLAILLALGRVFVAALRARAREARYRVLAESGSDMVWLYNLATRRFEYISPSVESLCGYTVAEALQKTVEDLLIPESYQRVSAELPDWLAAYGSGGEAARTRHYEVTQRRKDGSTVEVEVVATLIGSGDGGATHIQGISRDISERRCADEELRKLSLAVEQSPVSIVVTNLDAEIEYVNEAFVRATGYSRDEALGQNPRILQSGKTPPASYAEMWANLTRGLPWRGELHNRRKDGSEYLELASISPVRLADGRIVHYLAVKEDITERRRMEAALTESEDKFRTIYDTINDAIFVHDAVTGRILDVNASACRMYGYARRQLLELDLAAVSANVPPYTMDDARRVIGVALRDGWNAFEWHARDSAGRLFWVAVNLKTFELGGGRRILAVVRDIDQRKQAEEALKQALADARVLNEKLTEAQNQLLQSEKMASIGQLAAGVAHELNNPIGFVSSNLNTLEGYLQDIFAIIAAYAAAETGPCATCTHLDEARTLKRDRDFDFLRTDTVQLMAESKDGLARVAKIVRDLKDFSRAGEARFQWADLRQGLESTLNIVWNELKYKCTVEKQYGELPPVFCEPSQINQVFMNLLVNAAQAIPERGVITLRTGQRGDMVFVAIADTGAGIAPEHLGRIFDPFFTTKPVGKGTGLGLSLAYSIVHKHGGRIEVESELGRGTTFTVWLPIASPAADVPAAPL